MPDSKGPRGLAHVGRILRRCLGEPHRVFPTPRLQLCSDHVRFRMDARREVFVRIFARHSALSLPAFRCSESMSRRWRAVDGRRRGCRGSVGTTPSMVRLRARLRSGMSDAHAGSRAMRAHPTSAQSQMRPAVMPPASLRTATSNVPSDSLAVDVPASTTESAPRSARQVQSGPDVRRLLNIERRRL